MASQSIGYGKDRCSGEVRIFVELARPADIGGSRKSCDSLHLPRTSITVFPSLTSSPGPIGVGSAILSRLSRVPFVEPRSSTNQVPSLLKNLVCSCDV